MLGKRDGMDFSEGVYSIKIAGRWKFEDLTTFTSEYQKLYGFYYHTLSERSSVRRGQVGALPWRGGYSTVHFFNRLYHLVPSNHRPRIKSIQYASPGSIDLQAAIEVAKQISILVGTVGAIAYGAFEVYKRIRKDLFELKLTGISAKEKELDLANHYADFINDCIDEMAPYLGEEHKNKILEMAPNKLAALKLQLTVFRRIEPLAELSNRGLLEIDQQVMERKPVSNTD